jgi:hypothetical protein
MQPPSERLEALAADRGWRLIWATSDWPMYGARIRSLEVRLNGRRVTGAATVFFGFNQADIRAATESAADMILASDLLSRGARR